MAGTAVHIEGSAQSTTLEERETCDGSCSARQLDSWPATCTGQSAHARKRVDDWPVRRNPCVRSLSVCRRNRWSSRARCVQTDRDPGNSGRVCTAGWPLTCACVACCKRMFTMPGGGPCVASAKRRTAQHEYQAAEGAGSTGGGGTERGNRRCIVVP